MFHIGDHVTLNPSAQIGEKYDELTMFSGMAECIRGKECVISDVINHYKKCCHYRLEMTDSYKENPFFYAEGMLVAFIKVDIEKNHLLNFL